MNMRNLNKTLFNGFMKATHWLTRSESRQRLAKPLMRALGRLTLLTKGGKRQSSVAEIAAEWQRMFPSKKAVPIIATEGETVIAEIRTPCPYRGSGNVAGCHRMMEYDRRMLETLGADFVVLQSQAEAGVDHCRVAITRELQTRRDLVPAHLRTQAK